MTEKVLRFLFLATVWLAAGGFVVATILTVATIISVDTSNRCLAAGWPTSKVDSSLRGYCIKRRNQTDVVKLLAEIERKGD